MPYRKTRLRSSATMEVAWRRPLKISCAWPFTWACTWSSTSSRRCSSGVCSSGSADTCSATSGRCFYRRSRPTGWRCESTSIAVWSKWDCGGTAPPSITSAWASPAGSDRPAWSWCRSWSRARPGSCPRRKPRLRPAPSFSWSACWPPAPRARSWFSAATAFRSCWRDSGPVATILPVGIIFALLHRATPTPPGRASPIRPVSASCSATPTCAAATCGCPSACTSAGTLHSRSSA